jgi:hypothetical protein
MRHDRNVPTWRYLYRGNFTSLSPTTWLGAYHTGKDTSLIPGMSRILMMIAEIPIVFGTYNLSTAFAPSVKEAEASRYIQSAVPGGI